MTDTAMGLLREAKEWLPVEGVTDDLPELRKLHSRITALLDSGGWLPIDTAPKDRKVPVMITGGTFHWEGSLSSESAPMNHREIAHYNGDVYDDGGEAFYWYRPTLWQPLPPLPKG